MTLSLWKSHTSKKINCLLPRDEIFPHNYYQAMLRRKKWWVTNTNDKYVYTHFCLFSLNFPDYFFLFSSFIVILLLKVYNMVIWYTCILWNNDYSPLTELFFIFLALMIFYIYSQQFWMILFLNILLNLIFKFFLPSETFPGISIHVVKNVKFRK